MNILKNKWFILGNILLLLAVIPITLFIVKQQQNVKSKAAPSTTLSLEPASVPTTDVGQTFDVQLMVDPGQNVVAIVNATINYPANLLQVTDADVKPNAAIFPVTLKKDVSTPGTIVLSVTTGSQVTQAVQTKTSVATITFKAIAPTDATTPITIAKSKSEAFSLASADGVTENVLSTVADSSFTTQQASASTTPSVSPAPTGTDTGGGTNVNPVCSSLGLDRDLTGVAPYSVVFTATGTDSDGTITKVTFNFGDGPATEVTTGGGIGTGAVSLQLAHTYNNPGSYTATAVLTDNANGTSDTTTCTQTVTVTGSTTNTGGGTGGGTGGAAPTPATPLQTGSTATTIGIVGGIILTIIGGIALLAL